MVRRHDRGRVVLRAAARRAASNGCSPSAVASSAVCGSPATAAHEPGSRSTPDRRRRERLQRMQRADAHVGPDARASRRTRRRPSEPARCTTSAPGSSDGATRAGGRLDRAVGRRDDHERRAAARVGDERGVGVEARGGRRGRRGVGRAARDRDDASSPARAARARSSVPARPGPTSASVRRSGDGCLRPCPLFYASDGSDNVTPASRTPSHVASASTRSGATSRSGASTKPRSHMRGCGTVRSGVVDAARRRTSSTSTSSVRGPHRSHAHALGALPRSRGTARSSSCGSRLGVDRDDRVQVRVLRRPADRRGLVHARDRDHVDARRRARARRPRAAATRAGRRGSSRARGTRAGHVQRSMRTPTWSTWAAPAGRACAPPRPRPGRALGEAHVGDARRELLEQLVVLVGDRRRCTASHDSAVVGGVGERRRSRPRPRGRRAARGRRRRAGRAPAPRPARRARPSLRGPRRGCGPSPGRYRWSRRARLPRQVLRPMDTEQEDACGEPRSWRRSDRQRRSPMR